MDEIEAIPLTPKSLRNDLSAYQQRHPAQYRTFPGANGLLPSLIQPNRNV